MRAACAAAAISAALAGSRATAAIPVPALAGPVVDRAGVVDAASAARLEAMARTAWRDGAGPQLQFVVVRSLEGEPIEEFSMRVAEAWRLGTARRDDGVLVAVAIDDRRARIEVGAGVEGDLTDARSARIVRNVLAPAFRAGRYGPGLVAAGEEILAALGTPVPGGRAQASAGAPAEPRGGVRLPFFPGVLFLGIFLGAPLGILAIVVLFVVAIASGRRRGGTGASWSFDSGSSSSDFSSSSFGSGGSWSGGGGSFSGGGASGSW